MYFCCCHPLYVGDSLFFKGCPWPENKYLISCAEFKLHQITVGTKFLQHSSKVFPRFIFYMLYSVSLNPTKDMVFQSCQVLNYCLIWFFQGHPFYVLPGVFWFIFSLLYFCSVSQSDRLPNRYYKACVTGQWYWEQKWLSTVEFTAMHIPTYSGLNGIRPTACPITHHRLRLSR